MKGILKSDLRVLSITEKVSAVSLVERATDSWNLIALMLMSFPLVVVLTPVWQTATTSYGGAQSCSLLVATYPLTVSFSTVVFGILGLFLLNNDSPISNK